MKKRSYSKRNPNYMQSLDGSGPRKFIKVKSTNDYVDIHDPSGRMLDGYIRFVDGLQGGLYSVYLASEEVNDLGEPLEYYKTNESEYIPPSPFYVEPNPQKGTNKQKTRDALRMLRAALAEATDTESGRQPSKRHADFVMRLKAGIEELEKELKGSKRNPRYLVSRDGNEVGIFPGFNALMAINAARKIYGPGKYSSVKTGEAMFLGRGALQAEERLREETAARAARKAAAKRDKIQLPKKSRTRRNAAGKADILQQGVKAGLLPAGLVTDLKRLEEGRYSDDPKRRENLMSRAIILRSQLIYRNMIEKDPLNEAAQRALESVIVKEVQWQKQHKQNPRTRRNAAEKDSEHPIEVTRHYRSGGPNYLSPWQRAMAIGQEELFDTGIQMLPRVAERRAALFAARNPGATKRAYESGLKEATAAQLARLVRVGLRVGRTPAEIRSDLATTGRFSAEQIRRAIDQATTAERRSNPQPWKIPRGYEAEYQTHSGKLNQLYGLALQFYSRQSPMKTPQFIADAHKLARLEIEELPYTFAKDYSGKPFDKLLEKRIREFKSDLLDKAKRRSNRNPPIREIFETFNGRPATKTTTVQAPRRTPARVAQLGRLRLIRTADGRTWRFPGERAPFLAADSRGKLHVVGGQYRANPAGEICGEIEQIEYQTSKPHLGHDNETIYYHQLGEETGERPILEITPEGELQIIGGDYRIEADGIHN